MHIKAIGFIIIALFIFIACVEEEITVNPRESQTLEGYWVDQQVNDTLFIYEKSGNLNANQYGFAFLPDGKFIERKNAGWCGTPPVAYADFEGSWSFAGSIVSVTVGYWGGTATYLWQVVSLDDERLAIDVISEDYSQEN